VKNNVLAFVGGLVVLCVILGCLSAIFGGSKKPATSPTGAASGPTATLAIEYGIGDEVKVGTTTWMVMEAGLQNFVNGQFGQVKANGKFVVVTAEVTNGGNAAETLLAPNIEDSAGRSYETTTDSAAVMTNDGQCSLERLNPGSTKRCTFLYDVPAGATTTGWRLKATELGLFGTTKDILLEKVKK
jgi:hypothetical protein